MLNARIEWAVDTLAFRDKRCAQHRAIWGYSPVSRHGERISPIGNDRPTA